MEVKCPTCKKMNIWENNPQRPFCSERCKLLDLGAWAMEKHAIPGDHADPEKDSEKIREQKDDED